MIVRRLLYIIPVALFLLLAGYFLMALRPGYDPHALPSALIDQEAPSFELAKLAAEGTLTLDALKGKPAVVNFFASWCVPCRQEHPLLMRLGKTSGVRLFGIAYKDKPEDSTRFLTQLGDPYGAIGVDRDGRTGLDFGVYGVPETYVLDAAGHIRKRFVGPLSADKVDKELLPLLRSLGGGS